MIRIDRLLTLCFFRPLLRLRGVSSATLFPGLLVSNLGNPIRIPILMYHSISDNPELGVHPYYRTCTSPVRFREHMQFLHRCGYQVISLTSAVELLTRQKGLQGHSASYRKTLLHRDTPCPLFPHNSSNAANSRNPIDQRNPSKPRYVVLTFDDGFRDFLTHAWPVLAEFGFTASVFLPTAFIADARSSFNGRECLTWSEVGALHSHGISFGSHTVNHVQLHDLGWPTIKRELVNSRMALEDHLGHAVTEFSYPYAYPEADRSFCGRLASALRAGGYAQCVTTRIGRASTGDNHLSLKRLPVNGVDDLGLFLAKLEGLYDWLGVAQSLAKTFKRGTGHRNSYSRTLERAGRELSHPS